MNRFPVNLADRSRVASLRGLHGLAVQRFTVLLPFPRRVKELLRADHEAVLRFVEIMGFEPTTYGLQSRRSSQLSYIPSLRSPY